MSEHFPKQNSLGGIVKVELNLSDYTTKADLKNEEGVDTSKFSKKVDLVSLKSNVDKLDIDKSKNVPSNLNNLKSKVDKLDVDKLVPVPVEVSKLSDVVESDVVKKDVYKVKIKTVENKIPDIANLAANATLNAKTNQIKNEIPSITDLTTNTALTSVENKMLVIYSKKLTMIPTLMKLKTKLLVIMIMINRLLLKNLIS